MRNTATRFTMSLLSAFTMIIGVALGQVALADSDDLSSRHGAPVATDKAAAPSLTGLQVYNEVCTACHYPPGLGGAPALGDRAAWAARIATGIDTLIDHALNGYSGSSGIMPRKGGRLDLSDEEITGAVEYMLEQVAQ